MNNTIDCRGLNCPLPVVNTKKYFDTIEQGISTTIVDNEVAKNNILRLVESSGYKNEVEEKEGLYYITITKEVSVAESSEEINKKTLTITVSTDKLGLGDDKLGETLMKSYMFALSEADIIPDHLVFLNGGVKLTTKDSLCLESIQKLKDKGVNILVCGTCLDFYGLKEVLAVGEISNMYAIVGAMNSSDNTIKL